MATAPQGTDGLEEAARVVALALRLLLGAPTRCAPHGTLETSH